MPAGPAELTRPGDFSMAIAQLGHIGETAIATWLDPAEAPDDAVARSRGSRSSSRSR